MLLHELLPALPVDVQSGSGSREGVILKDPAHVIEQPGNRQHDRGRAEVAAPLQEELGILIARLRRPGEPIRYSCSILVDSVSLQILFAQTVSGEMASVFRRLPQLADALIRSLHFPVTGEEQLAKRVLGFRQALFRRLSEPVL